MVTFSYIDDVWTKNTMERRAECLETKDFVCCCPRCIAPDATNGVLCPKTECVGFAVPSASEYTSGDGGVRGYVCDTCGPLSRESCAELLERETQLFAQLLPLKSAAYQGDVAAPDRVKLIATIASQALSPTHWLVALAHETHAMFCVHHATHVERAKARREVREPFGSAASLHVDAALAYSSYIAVCECMAASCRGGAGCPQPHPSVHECVKAAWGAAQELRKLKPRARPTEICNQLDKYLPHMEMVYKSADCNDVRAMLEETRARTAGGLAEGPPRSEAEVAAEWLSGLGLADKTAADGATPRSRAAGGGGKKKGKGKR